MSEQKLLEKLSRLLDKKNPNQEQIEKLHKVLHKLKKKQRALESRLSEVNEEQRQELARSIEIIKLQRSKGLTAYKSLKNSSPEQH
jgi:tRNA C32,U32 (ribose-2'-O)-methylase TrmJ